MEIEDQESPAEDIFGQMVDQQSEDSEAPSEESVEPVETDESTASEEVAEESSSEEESPQPQNTEEEGENVGDEVEEESVEESTEETDESTDETETEEETTAEDTATELQTPTFEALQEKLNEYRDEHVEALQSRFAMSEEDVESFLDNPQEQLPKMAARVMWDTYSALWATVVSQMPNLMNQVDQTKERSTTVVNKFFDKFNQLDPKKDADVVRRIAINYRKQNPTTDVDTMIEDVGYLALAATGKHKQAAQPAKPKPKVQPPKPAGQGGRLRSTPQPESDNIFTLMADEADD